MKIKRHKISRQLKVQREIDSVDILYFNDSLSVLRLSVMAEVTSKGIAEFLHLINNISLVRIQHLYTFQ